MGDTGILVLSKEELLKRIKNTLAKVYGERLKGIVLYGSEARGDAEPDSDIDFLVLLDGPVKIGQEISTIVDALYPLQLEVIRPLHGMPTDIKEYEDGKAPLYRNVKVEGIRA